MKVGITLARIRDMDFTYIPMDLQHPTYGFVNAMRVGDVVEVSGQVSLYDIGEGYEKTERIIGRVGAEVDLTRAQRAAEMCALNCLRAAGAVVDIESIAQLIRVRGFVNGAPGFNDFPSVIDAASKFFLRALGPTRGAHTRTAVGVVVPLDYAVELDATFLVSDK